MNQKTRLAVLASLAAVSNVASATDCSAIVSFYNSGACDATCTATYPSTYPQCFATSSKSTTSAQIAATSVQQVTTISNAVTGRLLALGFRAPSGGQKLGAAGEVTGLAAAGNAKPYTVWGNLGQAGTSYSGNSSTANADKFSSDVTNTVLGFDYGMNSNMVVGLSVAADRGTGSTGTAATGTSTRGLTYAPYIGWQLNKTMALDATAGWGDGKFTSAGATADTKRSFYAANLSYSDWKGDLQLIGKAGYIVAKENYGNAGNATNSSSSNTLSQFRIGGDVGYWMNGTMPFAGLAFLAEDRSGTSAAGLTDNSKLGKSAFVLNLGVNFFSLSSGITGGVVYNQEFNRSNGKNNNLSANISMKF